MPNDLVDIAKTMVPIIQKCRDETENNRRLADEIVAQIRLNRLAGISLAGQYGGSGLPIVATLRAFERFAAAEASVAWILWNCALVTLVSRYMTPSLRDEVFADPGYMFAQSTRPTGIAIDAGENFKVSGRWSLVSGCEQANWLFLTCQVQDKNGSAVLTDGVPKTFFVSVPRAEIKIIDTWYSSGLRGSGSHDVEISSLVVPRHRTFGFDKLHRIDASVARVPVFCVLKSMFAAQTMGLAQCALDNVLEMGATNITAGPMPDLRDRADAQAAVAELSSALPAARNYLYAQVEAIWSIAVADGEPTTIDIANVYGSSANAVSVSKKIVENMHSLGGTKALYTDSPLERHHRDIQAMLRHVVAQPLWTEDAGRVLFGMQPAIPVYLL